MRIEIQELVTVVFEMNPSQEKFIKKNIGLLTEREEKSLAQYIQYSLENKKSYQDLAQAYLTIVEDTHREQMFFRRHLRYRNSTFAEVANSVYFNAEYMTKYMDGLALTLFLWPNHLKMKRFYDKFFPINNRGSYLEIGPGHGVYFMTAMQKGNFQSYLGIDISSASAQMTRDILGSKMFGDFSNYEIIEHDFLEWESDHTYDAIVMGEVLEHVEDPVAILSQIKKVASNDAFIFVTTCIDSPAVDHITHYTSMDHIGEHVKASGLNVKEYLLVPYGDLTLEESHENRLPVTVALVLEKTSE